MSAPGRHRRPSAWPALRATAVAGARDVALLVVAVAVCVGGIEGFAAVMAR